MLEKHSSSKISFCGDSAGGGLAIASMLYCRDYNLPMPGSVCALCPYLDLTHSMPSWVLNEKTDYLPNGLKDSKYNTDDRLNLYLQCNRDLYHPYASPIMAKEVADKPISPTLIQVGNNEKPRDDGIFFSTYPFKNSGIKVEVYENAPHVFQLLASTNSFGRHALERIGDFIKKTNSPDFDSTIMKPEFSFIKEDKDYSVHKIENAQDIIENGINELVKQNIWTREIVGDDILISKIKK